ncbi:MAG: dienelactone hydrolase family protein [Halanaeroarchaeum sp.]
MPQPTTVSIETDDVSLPGDLTVPPDPGGLVVFAHGSGSSRKSPRNQFVAETLVDRGLATLLFDLLTPREDQTRENRFDIDFLTDRLVAATDWVGERDDVGDLPIGLFGSSTGAAAAIRAAAERRDRVAAVVSRGGRVDLAEEAFDAIDAPTLLVVGGADTQVLAWNRDANDRLACESSVSVVEGAGHLFEGEGELEAVADRAGAWFVEQFTRG